MRSTSSPPRSSVRIKRQHVITALPNGPQGEGAPIKPARRPSFPRLSRSLSQKREGLSRERLRLSSNHRAEEKPVFVDRPRFEKKPYLGKKPDFDNQPDFDKKKPDYAKKRDFGTKPGFEKKPYLGKKTHYEPQAGD